MEDASGKGASSQGGGRVEDLDSESDPDMTKVWPPVPLATREAPTAEPGVGAEGVTEGNLLGDLRVIWRFRRAPRTAKRTHDVPVAKIDHELPVG